MVFFFKAEIKSGLCKKKLYLWLLKRVWLKKSIYIWGRSVLRKTKTALSRSPLNGSISLPGPPYYLMMSHIVH